MMPGENNAFTTCLGTMGMYISRRTLMFVCMYCSSDLVRRCSQTAVY